MEPKFKIGDKVRFKTIAANINLITEIITTETDVFYSLDNFPGSWNADYFELIQEELEPRKIIGYKVPFDIYGGDWKKYDIAVKLSPILYFISTKSFVMPKEVVETWEPVYEGIKVEKPKTIFERVNSFEDACRELGLNFESIDDITNSVQKLKIICKALNEGWVADWDDHEQNKWRSMYNTTTKELFIESNISLLEMPKSLYLKSEALAKHLSKIAVKELLQFFEL